jgi:drug/metabolite transporter (DMT)-like permease
LRLEIFNEADHAILASLMLFLALTIISSVLTSMILKINEGRGGHRGVVAGMNYVMAMALALMMSGTEKLAIGAGWGAAGLAMGIGFVAGFVMLMRGLKEIGLAIPTSAARLSMLIPVTGSILLFNERPSLPQIAGIIAGVAAFVLLGLAQRRRDTAAQLDLGAIGILVSIFVIVGTTDFGMKIAKTNGVDGDALTVYIFGAASLICWTWVALGRTKVTGRDLMLGALLGIPNYFSVYFLLLALGRLDASIVFPSVSAGAVVLVTIVAVIFWKEHPNGTAWMGIALAAIAVALLGLSQ